MAGGGRQWQGYALNQWRACCSKLFKQFNQDARIQEALVLTPRAGELLAIYAEEHMVHFLEACLKCSVNR